MVLQDSVHWEAVRCEEQAHSTIIIFVYKIEISY